jgi:hypothetical protein
MCTLADPFSKVKQSHNTPMEAQGERMFQLLLIHDSAIDVTHSVILHFYCNICGLQTLNNVRALQDLWSLSCVCLILCDSICPHFNSFSVQNRCCVSNLTRVLNNLRHLLGYISEALFLSSLTKLSAMLCVCIWLEHISDCPCLVLLIFYICRL